jgi:hypothetical protein
MTEINYLKDSNTVVIKARFKAAKAKLKALRAWKISDFSDHVIELHPEFDCVSGATAIQEAWWNKKGNLKLLEIIEELVEELENH